MVRKTERQTANRYTEGLKERAENDRQTKLN